MEKTIEIPEGYEARIEGNKVIIELKESERIRRMLIEVVNITPAAIAVEHREEMLAYLEKQGQTFTKKDVDEAYLKGICDAKHELEKQGSQNLANSAKTCKDEPKFKVGDTIKPKDGGHEPWQIMQVDILDKKYRFKDGYVIHFSQEDNYELVEQNPAWSEEDEKMLQGTIDSLRRYQLRMPNFPVELQMRWLSSLKNRI